MPEPRGAPAAHAHRRRLPGSGPRDLAVCSGEVTETGPPPHPPSVDALARSLGDTVLPPPLRVQAARAAIAAGDPDSAGERAAALARTLLGPVVNATGVLLHTNLGRAPVAHQQAASSWNLEIDLESGWRRSRQLHAVPLLRLACGAEDALVVNNGAAAVLLTLSALASGRPVLVSRGELVEIGGGFRLPEVLQISGARLVEVGTTNRTRLDDYRRALDTHPDTAAVLKVHQSNYRIVGFTEAVAVEELAGLGPPVVVDVGSGLLDGNAPWLDGPPPSWLSGEPAVRQTLEAGATAVTFSGDKLLGGPQAGIVAGDRAVVAACAGHPLARALRPGAMTLLSLQETLLAYLRRDAAAIPFWRMAMTSVGELEHRAAEILRLAGEPKGIAPVACQSTAGGGSLPGLGIPSAGLALDGDRRGRLRANDPPIIARVHNGRTVLDLRTVDPDADTEVAKALGRFEAG